jgi:hypothetical protein
MYLELRGRIQCPIAFEKPRLLLFAFNYFLCIFGLKGRLILGIVQDCRKEKGAALIFPKKLQLFFGKRLIVIREKLRRAESRTIA